MHTFYLTLSLMIILGYQACWANSERSKDNLIDEQAFSKISKPFLKKKSSNLTKVIKIKKYHVHIPKTCTLYNINESKDIDEIEASIMCQKKEFTLVIGPPDLAESIIELFDRVYFDEILSQMNDYIDKDFQKKILKPSKVEQQTDSLRKLLKLKISNGLFSNKYVKLLDEIFINGSYDIGLSFQDYKEQVITASLTMKLQLNTLAKKTKIDHKLIKDYNRLIDHFQETALKFYHDRTLVNYFKLLSWERKYSLMTMNSIKIPNGILSKFSEKFQVNDIKQMGEFIKGEKDYSHVVRIYGQSIRKNKIYSMTIFIPPDIQKPEQYLELFYFE